MPSPRMFPLLYFLLLLLFSGNATTGITSFDFQTFSATDFKLLGEAHVFNNSIRLTPEPLVPDTSAGRVLYNKPIRFLQPGNPTPMSFTTTFSFSIDNLNPNSIGGGMAFVISPDDEAIGDPGGHMGIPTGAVAVEFDTCMDVEFKDVNGNHVGLDLGSMVSSHVADLHSANVNLRSGKPVKSWIDYSGPTNQLNIYISYSNTKPKSPVLSITVNLNEYVQEFMFVGMSASTQGSTEVHSLQRWSFNSSFDSKPEPNSPTIVNTSQPSTTPTAHTTKKQSKLAHLKSKNLVKIMVALGATIAVVVAVGWYCKCKCFCCSVKIASINFENGGDSEGGPIRKN